MRGQADATTARTNRKPKCPILYTVCLPMSKVLTMQAAIASLVPDGSSVALGLQMEQMIPFAAGHEIIRQSKRDLRLIGPISDILFDELIGAGCVKEVIENIR